MTSTSDRVRELAIAPGMSATLEIRTDTRKVIGYVLSPERYPKESVRER